MKHYLKNIVSDTVTNAEGFKLFMFLDKSIKNETIIELSFDGATALSSSFLNSSIGEIVERHDFDDFKHFIKFVDLKQSIANQIKNYLNSCDLHV